VLAIDRSCFQRAREAIGQPGGSQARPGGPRLAFHPLFLLPLLRPDRLGYSALFRTTSLSPGVIQGCPTPPPATARSIPTRGRALPSPQPRTAAGRGLGRQAASTTTTRAARGPRRS